MSGFGGFGSRPGGFGSFGAQNTSPFGAQNNATNTFGQPAANTFGQATQPAAPTFGGFGQPPSTPAPSFGGASGFGAQSTPAFGQTAQTPGFGAPQPATSGGFGGFGSTPANNTFSFGATANKPFGAPTPAGGSMFGGGSTFGAGQGNLFAAGAQQPLDPSKWPDEFGDLFMVGHPAEQDDARVGWIQPAIPPDGTGNTAYFDPTNPREYKEPYGSEDGKNNPAKLREERVRSGWPGNPIDWDPVKKKLESRKDAKLRYHAITAVEPFRNASFEELRLQDYMQNRRAPTQQKPQEKIMAYNQWSADPPVPVGGAMPFGAPTGAGSFAFGAKPGGFGTPAAPSTFGVPNSGAFGGGSTMFGGTAPSTGFGATPATPFSQSTGASFGSTPGTTFGTTPGFGSTPASAPSFSGFGAPQQPAPQNTFGQPAGGSLFNTAPAAASSAPFSFGTPALNKPAGTGFSFGSTPASNAPPAPNFGTTTGFNFNQQPAQAPSNPFGQSTAPNTGFGGAAGSTGLFNTQPAPFGQAQNNAPKAFSFGAPTTSSTPSFSLSAPTSTNNTFSFGGANNNQSKPFTGFGGTGTSSAPFSFGGSSTSGALGGGLGGSAGNFGFGSLGQPGLQQSQQHSLQASIDQNAYGQAQSALFNVPAATAPAPAAPFAVQEKNKPPLTLPPRSTPRATPQALNRFRGLNSISPSTSAQSMGISFASPAGSSKASPLSSLPAFGDGTSPVISPRAFVGRNSVKKLVIEPKKAASPASGSKASARLRFDPDAEVAASNGTPVRAITAGPSTPTSIPNGVGRHSDTSLRTTNGTANANKSPGQAPYVLTPSLEELRRMSPDELNRVENFKVSRTGLGEIAWEKPVDLSGIGSLDRIAGSIVNIVARKASVYAVEDFGNNKPPPGSGLNTPARVTLHDIWPLDLATRKPIKERGLNEDLDARIDEFERKLTGYNSKRPTVTKAMYDFPNGTWIFHVQHFSGYGLDDDGELIDARDGGDMEVEEQSSRQLRGTRHHAPGEKLPDMIEEDETMDNDDYDYDDDEGPPTPHSGTSEHDHFQSEEGDYEEARRQRRSMTPDIMASPQLSASASLASPPLALSPKVARLPFVDDYRPGREQLMQGTLFATKKSKVTQRRVPSMPLVPPPPDLALPGKRSPPIIPTRRSHAYHQVSLSQSVISGFEGNIVDTGLALGRSFRASFAPTGELLRPSATGAVFVEKPLHLSLSGNTPMDSLLDVQLSRTDIQAGDLESTNFARHAPRATTQTSLRFRNFLVEGTDPATSSIARLASALFDDVTLGLPESATIADKQYAEGLLRDRQLSQWFEDDVRATAEAEASATPTLSSRIFAQLSAHQLDQACNSAIEAGDLRLATLLSQAGTGDLSVRRDIALQLDRWREQRADVHIEVGLRKIYELLAGNVSESRGTDRGDSVDHSPSLFLPEGLDWKRAFGLHLWYATPQPSLPLALASYTQAMSDNRLARPKPKWALDAKKELPANILDAPFELLRLAASDYPLEAALASQGFASTALDVRMPWHCAVVLTQGLRLRAFEDAELTYRSAEEFAPARSATADGLTIAFAMQLEVIGQWVWAAFVLLHLSLAESRTRGVKELLSRHVDELDDTAATSFLVERLGIPAEWLYEAQALRACYRGDLWQEMTLRSLARDYNATHRICVSALAPEAVLSDDLDLIHRLFEPLEQYEVAGWQDGGGLFLDYANCLDKSSGDVSRIQRLSPRLLAALPNLIARQGRTDLRARACYSLMLARISRLASAADDTLRSLESVDAASLPPSDRLCYLADVTGKVFEASLTAACA